jgi:hypothetical protein
VEKVHKPAGPLPEVTTAAAIPDVQGNATIWYRLPEHIPPHSGKKPALGPAGSAGAEDAPLPPPDDATMQAEGWKAFRFNVPTYPMEIYRLVELPDGRLFGTAGSYEGNFLHDPKTGSSVHPGKCHLSHYATAIWDGKVYMSGYPSSPVYVYDPAKPWTAGTRAGGTRVIADDSPLSNPRQLDYLREAGTHKMYSATVANGKIYFGGRWYRNGSHGGLGWWDPKTRKTGGTWKPFSNYQVNFIAAAAEGRRLVISAHRVEDTVLGKPKPEQGALFFLDTATDELLEGKLEPVAKAKGPGPIVCVGGNRLVGWTENPEDPSGTSSILYGVDALEQKLLFRKTIPFKLPVAIGSNQMERWDYRLGPDGRIWTFLDGQTLACIDPRDVSVRIVGKTGTGGRLAFAGSDLYLGGTESLRCIRNINNLAAR